MMGYLAQPRLGQEHVDYIASKSREAIDDLGWLCSGDKGCMGTNGMLKITGRYKELIITAGGENIAPVPIEDAIKEVCGGIANVMMVGDQRKFNVALITLKTVGATGELPGTDELDGAAAQMNPAVRSVSHAMTDAVIIKQLLDTLVAINKNGKVRESGCIHRALCLLSYPFSTPHPSLRRSVPMSSLTPTSYPSSLLPAFPFLSSLLNPLQVCPSNASKIQKFTILPCDFSVTTEELTPTLKLKRGVVMKKYADHIESM